MVIGNTTFSSENWEETVDLHRTYNGWACIRYGIGEILVHYTDSMELELWLAKSWENDGNRTWTITLQDNVTFSNDRAMDAASVKQCFKHLLENHDRAPGDPQYFFSSGCAPGMSYNFGAYENEEVNDLIEELETEFDIEKCAELAIQLQQAILDDNAYRSFSISSFATISRSLSNSERFLLTCNAANGLPGCPLGTNAASPSAIYSFTHRQIMLRSAVYSLSSVRTEMWSSRCLCTISDFCFGVHTRFVWPFRTITTSPYILVQRKGRQHGGFPCVYLYLTASHARWL